MNDTLQRILSGIIILLGLMVTSAYAAAVAFADSRRMAAEEWGTLAGFGLFSAVVGMFWLATTFKRTGMPYPAIRIPPAWLSVLLFVLLVAGGFGLQIVDRASYLAPLLATLAFVAVAAFFLRITARWMPERGLSIRDTVLPGMWGVFIAPVILITVQLVAVVFLMFGIVAGIVSANPDFEVDPNLDERISEYLEESESSATSTDVPAIVETPTVAVALLSLIAVIAPLSEELVKAVGAILVLSRRAVVTRASAFQAGVAAGLGFAVFEGIGYTLASPASWHQLILLRAPVVIMHVAATSIVVMGWHRMRETGRGFIPYFIVGTALHAGWNALAVGFVYSIVGVDSGADPTAGQALSILGVLALLGALFVAASWWFVSSARKAGEGEQINDSDREPIGRTQAPATAILMNG